MDSNTIRVLNLNGGGTRGYLSLCWLRKFLSQANIPQNKIWEYFDVISGTSIGGIQSLAYSYGLGPDEIEGFFLNEAKWLFTIRKFSDMHDKHASSPSNRPSTKQKIAMMAPVNKIGSILPDIGILNKLNDYLNDTSLTRGQTFYKSSVAMTPYSDNVSSYLQLGHDAFFNTSRSYSNYGHNILQIVLEALYGKQTLQSLKTKVIIPTFEYDTQTFKIFSNYSDDMFFGADARIVDVARMTSAAPAYLPAFKTDDFANGGHLYIDGGIYYNNPTDTAVALGHKIKPNANRVCVLSVETGTPNEPFRETSDGAEARFNDVPAVIAGSALTSASMLGSQEMVEFNSVFKANKTILPYYYYYYDPVLEKQPEGAPAGSDYNELDNSTSHYFQYLKRTAEGDFANDAANINRFIEHLML